jgi:hypothetical protein
VLLIAIYFACPLKIYQNERGVNPTNMGFQMMQPLKRINNV